MKYILLVLMITISTLSLIGQDGLVRGTLYDGDTGESIPFATVYVGVDKTTGTSTDLDGAFELKLPIGIYEITFSYIGYSPTIIGDIAIKKEEIKILNAKIFTAAQTLSEIVVTSRQLSNTQTALLTIKRKSPNVVDGVSRELFSKAGDGDAGSAIKRVTGVSIVDGKHVLVRGLGDRYSKTVLNDMDLPGLDPDRNSVQIDLFPTQLIENIQVSKTFMPNLPGDFTGGLVNIKTREFPETPVLSFSASLGYNPLMNLKDGFLSYKGSSTPLLGRGKTKQNLPIDKNIQIPDPVLRDPQLATMTRQFNPTMGTTSEKSPLNQSYSALYGNQFKLGSGTLGLIGTVNYKKSFKTYQNLEYNTFLKFPETNNNNLFSNRSIKGMRNEKDQLLSGMAGINYKLKQSKFSLEWIRLQNGVSSAANLTQVTSETNPSVLQRTNLEYKERVMDHMRLAGKHSLGENIWDIEWKLSKAYSSIDEPDNRVTAFEVFPSGEDFRYELNPSVGAGIKRIWRSLNEQDYAGNLDLTHTFTIWNQRTSDLKFGGSYILKDRKFDIQSYLFRIEQSGQLTIQGDPDKLFLDQNIWDPSSRMGIYVKGNFEPSNTYKANQSITSAYVMNELPLGNRLKSIYGLRMEKVLNHYTGQNNLGDEVYTNQEVLNELDFLPSLNLLFEGTEKINVRLSVNRSLARPSFKEKSLAQIQDLISGKTFIGNIDLKETKINNYDLRIENYFDWGQLVSVSGFYKTLYDPIELVAYSDATPDNVQPRNSSKASIMGVELEMQKKLGFLGSFLEEASLGGNVSFILSKVQMGDDEFNSRVHNARIGEERSTTRPLVNQSPVLANVFLQYTSNEKFLNLNLSYHYQGKQLTVIGIGRNSDIYTLPFHSLNCNVRVKPSITNRMSISFSAQNVLNQNVVQVFQSYGSTDKVSEKYDAGRTFSMGVSFEL